MLGEDLKPEKILNLFRPEMNVSVSSLTMALRVYKQRCEETGVDHLNNP